MVDIPLTKICYNVAMKPEEGRYIKVLLWCYEKSEKGFSMQEILDKFKSQDLSFDMGRWINKTFFQNHQGDTPLVSSLRDENGVTLFSLTDKGYSAAVDYLELKAAYESGKQARIIAIISIVIGIVVGGLQIFFQILNFESWESFVYKFCNFFT
ncbi:MAG: hypothetical protein RLZZ76_67 [Candidatus Parcubacteria bacterium]|jgi:hypothetical protein